MPQLLVQCSHISKYFGSRTLFEDISLSIHEQEVFAFVGENGAGKTTLLKLLSGALAADSGNLSKRPHLRIGYLPQEILLPNSAILVSDFLNEGPLTELERQMTACLETSQLSQWGMLHETYERLGGYRRLPVEKALNGLKLECNHLKMRMDQLSTGQKIRILLAKALIENPDLLLLDEPTNHLDKEMLAWLKNTLQERDGATILVSHDRAFINATCNRLIEIKQGKLACYGGNWDFYLAEQTRRLEKQTRDYEAQEDERRLLKQKIKAISFAKAKPAPPSDRNIMAYDNRGGNHEKSIQRNLDLLKDRLEKIEENLIEMPRPKSIKGLKFEDTPLASSVAIELEEISAAFGERKLFSGLSERLSKGDRVILTGPNGAGKTTLLQCIAGDLAPSAGKIRIAPSAKIAYLDQEAALLPMEKTPLEYFENRFQISEEALRRELHKAAIGGAELLARPFSTLSTGQRKRLMLLSLILEKPNVLLLDEPTNHLDFMTLEALETALLHFNGALLAVSHDATFIEKIATRKWALPSPGSEVLHNV